MLLKSKSIYRAYWPLLEFSMGADLTQQDHETLKQFVEPLSKSFILVQDYYSWNKEVREWRKEGSRIMNSIYFISRFENMSFQDARENAKTMALDYEAEYRRRKDDFYQKNPQDAARLKRWIEGYGICLGSYHYWAMKSPRYQCDYATPVFEVPELKGPSDSAFPTLGNGQHSSDSGKGSEQRETGSPIVNGGSLDQTPNGELTHASI